MIWAFQVKIGVNPIHIEAITDIDPEKLTRRLLMAGFGKFRRDVDPWANGRSGPFAHGVP